MTLKEYFSGVTIDPATCDLSTVDGRWIAQQRARFGQKSKIIAAVRIAPIAYAALVLGFNAAIILGPKLTP